MINLNFKEDELTIYTNCETNRYNLINSIGHKILRNGLKLLQVNSIDKIFRYNHNLYEYDYILINSINNNDIDKLSNIRDQFSIGIISTINDIGLLNIDKIDKIIKYDKKRKK